MSEWINSNYLPIQKDRLQVPHLEMLLLTDGRIVELYRRSSVHITVVNDDHALFRHMMYARSSSLRNLAVSGKSTRTGDSQRSTQPRALKPNPPKNAIKPTTTVAMPSRICQDNVGDRLSWCAQPIDRCYARISKTSPVSHECLT